MLKVSLQSTYMYAIHKYWYQRDVNTRKDALCTRMDVGNEVCSGVVTLTTHLLYPSLPQYIH